MLKIKSQVLKLLLLSFSLLMSNNFIYDLKKVLKSVLVAWEGF